MLRAQQREDIFSRVGPVAFVMAIQAGPMTEAEREDLLDNINEPDLEKAARGIERFVRARLGPLVDAKNRESTYSKPPEHSDALARAYSENRDIKILIPGIAEHRKFLNEHPHDKRFDERLAYAVRNYGSPQLITFLLKEAYLFSGAMGSFPEMEPPSEWELEQGYKPLNL